MKQWIAVAMALVGMAGTATGAMAQSRPLVTEDAETVPAGNILIEAGFDYLRELYFPLSGLRGELMRMGTFGVSVGVSSIAEIQVDGGVRNKLTILSASPAPLFRELEIDGETTIDVEDLVVGTKVRIVGEGQNRPSIALRFATRLPNAGNESGLGLDTIDFHFGMAIAKTVQSVRLVGNFGFGILPDPQRGDRQNDVIAFGGSVARAVGSGVELVGELNGRMSLRNGETPLGTESRGTMRIGARFTHGPVRIDGAFMAGISDFEPSWGITTGITWVFRAFTLP